jgi:hypothetical protein
VTVPPRHGGSIPRGPSAPADIITKSREDECRKRGEAQEEPGPRRPAEVRAMADPQAQALHVDTNTVRTVQAAAMVGMCLAAGYIIAFGAGFVWPRG